MRVKPLGKLIIIVLVLGIAIGGYRVWKGKDAFSSFMPGSSETNSMTVGKIDLPGIVDPSSGAHVSVDMPSDGAGCTDKPEIRMLGYAWNAQMGLMFAIGGPQATQGSLMCNNGVNLKWSRQDDNGKLTDALVAFATDLSQGNDNPSKGAHFVTIMGDGSATFLKGLNDALKKLGPEYRAKVVGSIGYSRGEDKFMGPASWKIDPTSCRGGLVAGVIRDGDWNIAQKWLGDNNLKTNPNEKTWDPDALNWVNADDYLDAAKKYIVGYSEDRKVVKNGVPTGETKHVTVDACVTWTPGDVNIATQKGGVVPIVSTKEYASQMPCVVIGIDKWMKAHRQEVEGMLLAIAEGGDAVKSNDTFLHKAAQVSAKLYSEKDTDANYWEKYYRGSDERDKSGVTVSLGGSMASGLSDSFLSFGLTKGGANLFGATYKLFGDLVVQQYHNLVPSIDPLDDVLDTSYYRDLQNKNISTAQATPTMVVPKNNDSSKSYLVSKKVWHIPFDSGRAVFSAAAQHDLEKLRQDLLVASNTTVEIHGHTDNVGNPASNMQLSEARAFAVKTWLEKAFPLNFPTGRVKVFAHGQEQPLEPNTTGEGRAANRRVEVVIQGIKN
ncbi:MAG: OmpA family protein [Fimbriimonas sp.]|nr:OmpA family protein [Fimbriimonas sp.]